MTVEQLTKKQAEANLPFELARQIRELLDSAKKGWKGEDDWDDIETQVIELVTEE